MVKTRTNLKFFPKQFLYEETSTCSVKPDAHYENYERPNAHLCSNIQRQCFVQSWLLYSSNKCDSRKRLSTVISGIVKIAQTCSVVAKRNFLRINLEHLVMKESNIWRRVGGQNKILIFVSWATVHYCNKLL